MARYFFDVLNGNGFTADDEGQSLANVSAAKSIAVESVRAIVSEEAAGGLVDLSGEIRIRDEDGAQVMVVPFKDAVDLRLSRHPH